MFKERNSVKAIYLRVGERGSAIIIIFPTHTLELGDAHNAKVQFISVEMFIYAKKNATRDRKYKRIFYCTEVVGS
jgi:hypothetical protein